MFDGPDGYAAGLEAVARAWRPSRPLSVASWAAKYRILSAKSAAEPGKWRNERIPYLRAIMDALEPTDPTPIVVFVASSQVGKSECGLNWLGSTFQQRPASALALFPTKDVGRKWVRGRFDPMISTTPELREVLPPGRSTNNGNRLDEKHGPGFTLYVGSAGVADDVAQVSVPNILLDEVDRMPRELEDEGDPIDLALNRAVTFPRSKVLMTSTPTTADASRIWPWWQVSTQARYFVPCPDCGHMQHLRFGQVTYPEGKPELARYRCEACAVLIEERNKPEMLARGEWREAFPERAAEARGFHVNGLYTPLGLGKTWERHARAYERAKGRPERLQVFYNTGMGEVVKGEKIDVEWSAPHKRRQPYKLGSVPRGSLILTSGTDVQIDRVETQVVGWGRGEQARVIDYEVTMGDPTRDDVWAKLDTYLAGTFRNASGVDMRVACSLVDSGYLTDRVLSFTRSRKGRNIFASRGSSIAEKLPIGRPSYPDSKKRKGVAMDKRGLERYELGTSKLKHWLFDLLRADEGTPDEPMLPADFHLIFSDELGEEYFRQLTAETFDPVKGWIGRAKYHRNEALDTFLLARAAALHHSVALNKLREADWIRLEELYQRGKVETFDLGKKPIETASGFIPVSAIVRQ